jgi:hypothetical protein
LLEAQVRFVLAELSGKRFAKVVARDVDDVLTVAATVRVADIVAAEDVKEVGRKLVDLVGGSAMVADLLTPLADAIYTLAASDEHRLGDVVERVPVVALVAKVLSIESLRERALDRLGESPTVTTIAYRFAGKIVADFVQQNRARAERVPGVGSLLSFGTSAASRVKNATERQLEGLVGDATARGKLAALKATSGATRDLITDGLVQEAALELWDLHADEPISALREYLGQQDLRDLVLIVHELVTAARTSEYVGHLIDACVDVFFERYGDWDVAALLPELGLSRDDLVEDIVRFATPVLAAARADGVLEAQIRRRLEPFFHSKAVRDILGGEPAKRPKPAKPKA